MVGGVHGVGMHGGGACVAGGMCGRDVYIRGACVAGSMHGGGMWQGTGMVGGMCGGGCMAGGDGCAWQERRHSCFNVVSECERAAGRAVSGQGSGCGEFRDRGGCGSSPARGIVTCRKCIALLARCT